MEMSEIYNGSLWAHDIFLVNKAEPKNISRADPPHWIGNWLVLEGDYQ